MFLLTWPMWTKKIFLSNLPFIIRSFWSILIQWLRHFIFQGFLTLAILIPMSPYLIQMNSTLDLVVIPLSGSIFLPPLLPCSLMRFVWWNLCHNIMPRSHINTVTIPRLFCLYALMMGASIDQFAPSFVGVY